MRCSFREFDVSVAHVLPHWLVISYRIEAGEAVAKTARRSCAWRKLDQRIIFFGKSPIFNPKLSRESDFQPRTPKPDIMHP